MVALDWVLMEALTTRERAAIHEAGHAVASVLLGLGLKSVSIVPDGVSLGRTVPKDEGPREQEPGSDEWLEACVVRALAGYEAERRAITPEKFGVERVDNDDWDLAGDIVFSLGGESEGRRWILLNRCLANARVLLARNWNKVETVADELLSREMLDESEVSTILEGVAP